jgi:DNA repair exonuclease SbcCD ATPase subunit
MQQAPGITNQSIEHNVKALYSTLYGYDYNLWLLETVRKLECKDFASLDLENLIEEVLDLSRRDKQKLKSLLKKLIEHLLKLKYWQSEREKNQPHWQAEITNFRQLIRDELEASPSLKSYIDEIYLSCYNDARKIASQRSQLPLNIFPEMPTFNLDKVLDEDWLP